MDNKDGEQFFHGRQVMNSTGVGLREYYVYNTMTKNRVSRAVPTLDEATRLAVMINKTLPADLAREYKQYGVDEVDFVSKVSLFIHRIKTIAAVR